MIFAALDCWRRLPEGYSNARTNGQDLRSGVVRLELVQPQVPASAGVCPVGPGVPASFERVLPPSKPASRPPRAARALAAVLAAHAHVHARARGPPRRRAAAHRCCPVLSLRSGAAPRRRGRLCAARVRAVRTKKSWSSSRLGAAARARCGGGAIAAARLHCEAEAALACEACSSGRATAARRTRPRLRAPVRVAALPARQARKKMGSARV